MSDVDFEKLLQTVTALQAQVTALESEQVTKLPVEDSAWLVYNPRHVQVWCSKSDCPLLERERRVDIVEQPVDDELAEAMGTELTEGQDTVEVQVVRLSEPRARHHPLGVMAAFATEGEATKFVRDYYRKHQFDGECEGLNLCICEVAV